MYATRMGPYGLARDTLDGATQAKADNAVLAAFDSFVDGDMVRFNAACWTAVAHR